MSSESDPLINLLVSSIPSDASLESAISLLRSGDYHHFLTSSLARLSLGHEDNDVVQSVSMGSDARSWSRALERRINLLAGEKDGSVDAAAASDSSTSAAHSLFMIGLSSLLAFVQATITGPPLPFSSGRTILPATLYSSGRSGELGVRRQELLSTLSVDGEAPYRLTPHIELLVFAKAVFESEHVRQSVGVVASWAKLRSLVSHQRLLSERSTTLESEITGLFAELDRSISAQAQVTKEIKTEYLLEKAATLQYYGHEKQSKAAISDAISIREFKFAVTGRLGKRTKFQEKEVSQLVVLAKSTEDEGKDNLTPADEEPKNTGPAPANLPLEDDTLLPTIRFSKTTLEGPSQASQVPSLKIQDEVPEELACLDANEQPPLNPQDAIILLSLASAISASTPSLARDELTREEMGPFATRVLESGQKDNQGTNLNWQIYTQGLLVRSRIESYRTRTLERGLLQLVALRDQVVLDTTDVAGDNEELYKPALRDDNGDAAASAGSTAHDSSVPEINICSPAETTAKAAPTSFLPAAKPEETAPASSRVMHVFALASPYVWNLEAELAGLWVQVGGLRSALEIYERLEMWAEVALCWAGTEKDGRARGVVRRQLFERTPRSSSQTSASGVGDDAAHNDDQLDFESRGENVWKDWQGPERSPLPIDAPRLFCILGDLEETLEYYTRAWEVSHGRYARAQKSLGQKYYNRREFESAAAAFELSLKARSLDAHVWFMMGCCYLKLKNWKKAVYALGRSVQIDDEDAEAWVNLSAALLSLGQAEEEDAARGTQSKPAQDGDDRAEVDCDEEEDSFTVANAPAVRDRRPEALRALKHAARLRHEDFRIWDNIITVAAGMNPPPHHEIISSFRRVISLRSRSVGERAIDPDVLNMLVRYVATRFDSPPGGSTTADLSGEARMLVDLVEEVIVPLITSNAVLWKAVARLELWRKRPAEALSAHEKAWRCVTGPKEWESGVGEEAKELWEKVVDATEELADAYESFGPMEAGDGVVMKDWKFKTRSAIRGVMGRAKDVWEGSEGWDRLATRLEQARNA